MPGGDTTGPLGQGPMTGRGMGSCNGKNPSVSCGKRPGRGMGRGRGNGYGFNPNNANLAPLPQDELAILKRQKEAINNRISQIEKQDS